jgi:two-component system OmpR family response regulator
MTTSTRPRARRQPRSGALFIQRGEAALPARVHARCSILIVDDDPSIRETLRMALEDEGYTVSEAEDGAEALAILRESAQPLVALLDLRLPRMTGDALLRRIHRKEHLPARHTFLMVTANREQLSPASLRLLQRMHVSVIPKPFDLDDLLGRVALAADTLADGESAESPRLSVPRARR